MEVEGQVAFGKAHAGAPVFHLRANAFVAHRVKALAAEVLRHDDAQVRSQAGICDARFIFGQLGEVEPTEHYEPNAIAQAPPQIVRSRAE